MIIEQCLLWFNYINRVHKLTPQAQESQIAKKIWLSVAGIKNSGTPVWWDTLNLR